MKHGLLAIAVLVGLNLASCKADYLIIVRDLNKQRELKGQPLPPPGNPFGGPAPPPGAPPGPPPGGFGGPGAPPPDLDPDLVPQCLLTVIEIENVPLTQIKLFSAGFPIPIKHKWGTCNVMNERMSGGPLIAHIIRIGDKNASTLFEQFTAMWNKTYQQGTKDKPTPETVLTLADWCLKHGKLDKFVEVMEKFALDYPKHPAVVSYLQVKSGLAVKGIDPVLDPARTRLFQNLKVVSRNHYVAYHNSRIEEPVEVVARLNRLDDCLRNFCYWHALRGRTIAVPKERLPVVVTFREDDFRQFNEQLTATPIVADSFIGRREGVAVLASKRLDPLYDSLEKITAPLWADGTNRDLMVKTVDGGFPKFPPIDPIKKTSAQSTALLMKGLDRDAELAAASHDGTRQLLFATNMLPRNVVAPEWLQFGLSSFFETPAGTPWPSPGAASQEYLPLFKSLKKAKRLGNTPSETLKLIVTDYYFRQALPEDDPRVMRKARATAWALAYFLMQSNKLEGPKQNLDSLQKYFKELAKMPRDLDLDEDVLLQAFGKAFGLLDGSGKIDRTKFDNFATAWDKFIDQERLELEGVVDGIRALQAQLMAEAAETEKGKPGDPNFPPGNPNMNPGMRHPGPGPGRQFPPGYRPPGRPGRFGG